MKTTEAIDLGMLEQMLNYIPADIPRDEWAKFLMSAKSEFGETAKAVMAEWSARASNYNQSAFNSTWKSIKSGGGVTIGTLIHEAKENGFKFAPISKEEKQRLKREQKQRAVARKKQEVDELKKREQSYLEAQQRAYTLLKEKAIIANPKYPYFLKKGIYNEAYLLNWVYQSFKTLLIPVYQFKCPPVQVREKVVHGNLYDDPVNRHFPRVNTCDGSPLFQVVSIQFIDESGGKWFLSGGRTKGCFFPIRFNGGFDTIVICEGYATGVTYAMHYEIQADVICAFNARNLIDVSMEFRQRYPTAKIIIAGDNDRETNHMTGKNVGIEYALKAANKVDGVVLTPQFEEHEQGTDWNDRHLLNQARNNSHVRH